MGEEAVCKGLEVRENMVDSGNLLKLRLRRAGRDKGEEDQGSVGP